MKKRRKFFSEPQARRQLFVLAPSDLFLAPPRYYFWEEKVAVFGRRKRLNCDFGQKKSSDFGKDQFFFF